MNALRLKWFVAVLFFSMLGAVSSAQLLINPSFEVVTAKYPQGLWEVSEGVTTNQILRCLSPVPSLPTRSGWYIPSSTSSDVFNARVNGHPNPIEPATDALTVGGTRFENQKPQDGDGYVGLAMQSTGDGLVRHEYREYLAQKLCTPLTKGTTYRVVYYVATARDKHTNNKLATHSLRNVDLAFLLDDPKDERKFDYTVDSKPVGMSKTQSAVARFVNGRLIMPQVRSYDHGLAVLKQTSPPKTIQYGYDNDDWLKVTVDFKADEAYTHVLIGNFDKDIHEADLHLANEIGADESNIYAYYLIDNVSIEKLPDASCCSFPPGTLDVVRVPLTEGNNEGCCFNVTLKHFTCDACPISRVDVKFRTKDRNTEVTKSTRFDPAIKPGDTKTFTICMTTEVFDEQDAVFEFYNEQRALTCTTTAKIGCVLCGCKEINDPDKKFVELVWQKRLNDIGNDNSYEECWFDLMATNKSCRDPLSIGSFKVEKQNNTGWSGFLRFDYTELCVSEGKVEDIFDRIPKAKHDQHKDDCKIVCCCIAPPSVPVPYGCSKRLVTYSHLVGDGPSALKAKDVSVESTYGGKSLPCKMVEIYNRETCAKCDQRHIHGCNLFDGYKEDPPGNPHPNDITPGFPPFNTDNVGTTPFTEQTTDCCCCKYYTVDLIPDQSTTGPREYRVIVGHDTKISLSDGRQFESKFDQIPADCKVASIMIRYQARAKVMVGNMTSPEIGRLERRLYFAGKATPCGTLTPLKLPSKDFKIEYNLDTKLYNLNFWQQDFLTSENISGAYARLNDLSAVNYARSGQSGSWDLAVGPWLSRDGKNQILIRPFEDCEDSEGLSESIFVDLFYDSGWPICSFRGAIGHRSSTPEHPASPCLNMRPIIMGPTSAEDVDETNEHDKRSELSVQHSLGILHVRRTTDHQHATVRLFALDGSVLHTAEFVGSDYQINVSSFASGVYLLVVSCGSELRTSRVAIVH